MADTTEGSATELTFKVKTSGDGLHNVTISDASTVLDLKTKLSGADYENISVDRMRLIYSGRVLKDDEPLTSYKIKSGHTIHMVKSAASNPTPASTSAAASTPAQPAVPSNMSAGTSANNPLDNLTGARYAGFANLPSADLFGPNGGMGAPPGMDEMADMLANPQLSQAMNEAMNSPAFIDMMIQNNPMLRNLPNAREVLQAQLPAIRHLMSDPEAMRSMMRMRSVLEGGGGAGGAGASFPAPGATNTSGSDPASGQQPNPFAGLFGANPLANPLANPFTAHPPPYVRSQPGAGTGASAGAAAAAAPPAAAAEGAAAGATGASQPQAGAPGAAQANPFAALFQAMGQAGPGVGAGAGQAPPANPFMPDPQAMQNMLREMGLGGAGGAAAAAAPADTRPPEERYEQQLRQLNDMGFTDFDRNVTALRRSGGSVQGAIEFLLSG